MGLEPISGIFQLLCAWCGDDCTHHASVEVFWREEDAANGVHILSSRDSTVIDGEMRKNPSGRRDGVQIGHWCENCDGITILFVSQDKGATFIGTRKGEVVKKASIEEDEGG